jgi:hypothetical protein
LTTRPPSKERAVIAILSQMCRYRVKICMVNKLHDKIFVAWNRLHVFIRIVILFDVEMQANISVKSIHLVVHDFPENKYMKSKYD